MALRIIERQDRPGTYQIVGTIHFPDRSKKQVRRTAQSRNRRLAQEEASALEADLLRTGWHGEKRGSRRYADTLELYLKQEERSPGDIARHLKISAALGDVALPEVDQTAAIRIATKVLRSGASSSTFRRGVITPMRSVMNFAADLKWCERVKFMMPRERQGRTEFFLPSEVRKLVEAAAPHLRPLIIYGSRLAEAIELDWRDVDLEAGHVIYWADQTKGGTRRDIELQPAAIAALSALPHRTGRVFKYRLRGRLERYADYSVRERIGGGQIQKAWEGAMRRAGLADVWRRRTTSGTLGRRGITPFTKTF
jgi:integrase